jgi:hypothetical protein
MKDAMVKLITEPNLSDPDLAYARLIAWHEGRPEAESHRLNAKLVLILANHVGDAEVLAEAMALAEGSSEPS